MALYEDLIEIIAHQSTEIFDLIAKERQRVEQTTPVRPRRQPVFPSPSPPSMQSLPQLPPPTTPVQPIHNERRPATLPHVPALPLLSSQWLTPEPASAVSAAAEGTPAARRNNNIVQEELTSVQSTPGLSALTFNFGFGGKKKSPAFSCFAKPSEAVIAAHAVR